MFRKKKASGLVFYEKKKLVSSREIYFVLSWVAIVAGAVLLAYVTVFAFGIRTTVIGDSMEPALYNGQEIMINRLVYNIFEPKAGDIVVFKPNGNENAHTYVKRVVAIPGDTVRITDGVMYVNNEVIDYFDDIILDAGVAGVETTIGEDEYFVVGDNVNSSDDSRNANIGNVKIDTIIGKAWFHMAGKTEGAGRLR